MATGLLNTIRAGGSTLIMTTFGTGLITLLQTWIGAAEPATRIAAGDLTGQTEPGMPPCSPTPGTSPCGRLPLSAP
ncbi:hypothetical protein [Nonomuraea dietziae]|uniref:hypothetical protein n=1 Tax=Nonomuraea dietziae TaxID=65515 RepID=UPI003434C2B2